WPYEVIAVDDHSSDDSWETLVGLQRAVPALRCVRLEYNSGQVNATMAGIYQARGRFIVTIDDDLQYDPGDISHLYRAINSGPYELACGFSHQRQHREIYTMMVKAGSFLLSRFFLPRLRGVRLFSSFKIYRRALFF